MIVGKLRHWVTIERNNPSVNKSKDLEDDWEEFFTTWADIKPVGGSEPVTGNQVQAQITHTIKMRYFDGLKSSDRIVFGDRVFGIRSVNNTDERGIEWVVQACEET